MDSSECSADVPPTPEPTPDTDTLKEEAKLTQQQEECVRRMIPSSACDDRDYATVDRLGEAMAFFNDKVGQVGIERARLIARGKREEAEHLSVLLEQGLPPLSFFINRRGHFLMTKFLSHKLVQAFPGIAPKMESLRRQGLREQIPMNNILVASSINQMYNTIALCVDTERKRLQRVKEDEIERRARVSANANGARPALTEEQIVELAGENWNPELVRELHRQADAPVTDDDFEMQPGDNIIEEELRVIQAVLHGKPAAKPELKQPTPAEPAPPTPFSLSSAIANQIVPQPMPYSPEENLKGQMRKKLGDMRAARSRKPH